MDHHSNHSLPSRMIPGKYSEALGRKIIDNLTNRHINGYYAPTRSDARSIALSLIPDGAVVSQGGSITLEETGIRAALLQESRFQFIDPYAPGLSMEDRMALRGKSLLADVFLCSTNAITHDGILVNRDGMANRVAAMAFGPSKVIVVTGLNKVVVDVNAAMLRIDTIAAPMNCYRLNRDTPCLTELECSDCDAEDRICCVTTIIDWQRDKNRMHVILVGEELGF